jgi:hypothetical protein
MFASKGSSRCQFNNVRAQVFRWASQPQKFLPERMDLGDKTDNTDDMKLQLRDYQIYEHCYT